MDQAHEPEARQSNKDRFHSIFQAMSEGAAVHRILFNESGEAIDYEVVEVNSAFEKHTGIPAHQALGKTASLIFACPVPPFLDRYSRVARTGESELFEAFFPQLEKHFKISVSSPQKDWFVTIFSDISKHIHQETELRRINRLYLFLSQVNQAVVRTSSPDELFREVCTISITSGGFKMAWIGAPDAHTHQFIPIASAGDTFGYLSKVKTFADEGPGGYSPAGISFQENRPFVSNDFANDRRTLHWKEAILESGLLSAICLPVRKSGKPFAVLIVYSGEKDCFHHQEIQLLEEVAESISFALDHLDDEKRRKQAEKELSESESKFRVLFETSRDAILITTEKGVLDCNQASIDLFGCSCKEELLRKAPWEFSPQIQPDGTNSLEAASKRNQEVLAGGIQFFEWNHQRADGSLFPAEVHLTPFEFCGQMAIQSVVRDITQRKAAELELRNLSRAVEQSPVCIVITDLQGNIEYVNPKFTSLTGYTLEESLGQNPRMLQSGKLPRSVFTDLWTALGAGREWRGELLNKKKNGELFWESASISPITNSRGEMVKYLAVKEDITEKKQRIALIEESESRFRQLTENLESVFWMASLDTNAFLYVSPAYERIWGRSCQSLHDEPKSWLRAIHPDDHPRIEAIYQGRLSNGNYDETYRIQRPDGEIRWVRDRAFIINNAEGKPYRVAGIAEDVSESKLLNEQFLRAQRMESIGTLASGVAHDLNNVLAPIIMAISILKDQFCDPLTQELVETIEESALRGADIVKQVLTFARGIGGIQTNLVPDGLITQVGRIVKKTFPKSITYTQALPGDLWTISADPTQLHQVLLNLCVNARDAMPEGGTLTLTAENREIDEQCAAMLGDAKPGRYVMLKISDTGSGIPPAVQDKMFDPFFTTKEPGQGTGLGLSSALGIVRSHHGFLKVDSEVGKGSVFQVFLPAIYAACPACPEESASNLPQGEGTCILLVDDEQTILSVMGRVLARNGYQVLTAQDGLEALTVYCSCPTIVKLVITDVMMPQMDGIKLTRALRKLNPQLPIIASSGHSEEPHRKELGELGVQVFLRKPYNAESLLRSLGEIRNAKAAT